VNIQYLADRTPITPLGLVIGDHILAVHVEGQPDREIDVVVTSVYAELLEPGRYRVLVGHDGVIDDLPDSDDPLDPTRPLRLNDPGTWVSVAPRAITKTRRAFEVAA
jgi:hypothetical protein